MPNDRGHRGDGKLVRYLRYSNPELDLIKRAVNGGWDISEDKRAEIVDELMNIVRSTANRQLAVQAARILKDAVADDRRHELGILMLLQKDQEESVVPYGRQIDAESVKHLEDADTESIHAYMERLSQPLLESDEQDD